jgi:lysophospholipase
MTLQLIQHHWPVLTPQLTAEQLDSPTGRELLAALWQQASCIHLMGREQIRLCLWQLPAPPQPKAALIIVPGRIEASHKYAELCLDAKHAGYQVFVLDHRGQGLSQRLCQNQQIGVVYRFDHYAEDLALAIGAIRERTTLPLLAIAHSMGSAILYRYLQLTPDTPVLKAVCGAPMFGIPLGPLPALVRGLSHGISWLNRLCAVTPWFVPGQQPYQRWPFAGNDLTHCEARYNWFRDLYERYPAYQLGGVSWHWLAAALTACTLLPAAGKPVPPVLVVQAGEDLVVDNRAQIKLVQQHQLAFARIDSARHELWAGTDAERAQLCASINQFLAGDNGSA